MFGFYGVRNVVWGTFKFVNLLLTTPVSRGSAKPPRMAKSKLGCPKKNGPTTLGSAESLKIKCEGGAIFSSEELEPCKVFFQRSSKTSKECATLTLIVVFSALYETNHLKQTILQIHFNTLAKIFTIT